LSTSSNIASADFRTLLLGVIYPVQANIADRDIGEIVDLREFTTETNKTVYELALKPEVDRFSLSLVNNALVVNGVITGRSINGKDPREDRLTLEKSVSNPTSRHMCQNVLTFIDNEFSLWHTDLNAFKSSMTDNKYYWLDVTLDNAWRHYKLYQDLKKEFETETTKIFKFWSCDR
jgi:hypothetical protein